MSSVPGGPNDDQTTAGGDWLPTIDLPPTVGTRRPDTSPPTEAATQATSETGPEETLDIGVTRTMARSGDDPAACLLGSPGLAIYTNRQPAGRWKYGQLYDAEHQRLGRKVRLRILDPSVVDDDVQRAECLDMARSVALFQHPHVDSGIFEAVGEGAEPYIAAEPTRGVPLFDAGLGPRSRERLTGWLYPNARLGRCLLEATAGLAALHGAGLVHGHIRPEHIRYDPTAGVVRLAGLGEPPPEGPSVDETTAARDLADLAASFAAIVTGNPLPPRLLARGDSQAIRRALKWRNCWLRHELADLLARCMAGPGDSRRIRSANELLEALKVVLGRQTFLASWADRLGTVLYEGLLLLFASPFILLIATRWHGGLSNSVGADGLTIAGRLLIVIVAYLGLAEILFGRTPGRMVRGLKLVDPSGDRAGRVRTGIRLALEIGICGGLAILVASGLARLPAHVWNPFHSSISGGLILDRLGGRIETALASLAGGFILLQATAILLPRRRPIHDALTRTTWGRTERVDPPKPVAPTADSRMAFRPDAIVDQIDHLLLVRVLGKGGMGTVYEAWDEVLHRRVAVKRINSAIEAGSMTLRRFEQEAYLAAKINHPNVARLYGIGEAGGKPYLVMEYVEGEDLQDRVRRKGSMGPAAAWNCILQAARGLAEAHRVGIVHRDIKPSNLMIQSDGTVKVMDFGISKLVGHQDEPEQAEELIEEPQDRYDSAALHLTRTGALLGTPRYMSPEQAMGESADARSDIYSLGLTLHYLLTGDAPFDGKSVREVIEKQCTQPPPSLRRAVRGLADEQAQVVERMVEKDPAKRPQSYAELQDDLESTAPRRAILAGFGPRLAANLIDNALATLVFLIGMWQTTRGLGLGLMGGMLVGYVYLLVERGTSPGKHLFRLRAFRENGKRLGYLRAVGRLLFTVPTLVVGLLALVVSESDRWNVLMAADAISALLVVSGILLASGQSRLTIHDWALGTVVVQLPSSRRGKPKGTTIAPTPARNQRSGGGTRTSNSVGGSSSGGRGGSSPGSRGGTS